MPVVNLDKFRNMTPEEQEEEARQAREAAQQRADNEANPGQGISQGENLEKRAQSDEDKNPSKPTGGLLARTKKNNS